MAGGIRACGQSRRCTPSDGRWGSVVEGSLQSRAGGIVPGGSGMLVCDSAGTAATDDAAVTAAEHKKWRRSIAFPPMPVFWRTETNRGGGKKARESRDYFSQKSGIFLAAARACRHLSQARAQARWIPARKFRAVFS